MLLYRNRLYAYVFHQFHRSLRFLLVLFLKELTSILYLKVSFNDNHIHSQCHRTAIYRRLIKYRMRLRPRQGFSRQVFISFDLIRGYAEHDTNNLKTSLRISPINLSEVFDSTASDATNEQYYVAYVYKK